MIEDRNDHANNVMPEGGRTVLVMRGGCQDPSRLDWMACERPRRPQEHSLGRVTVLDNILPEEGALDDKCSTTKLERLKKTGQMVVNLNNKQCGSYTAHNGSIKKAGGKEPGRAKAKREVLWL